jgi:chromosome segregation protein
MASKSSRSKKKTEPVSAPPTSPPAPEAPKKAARKGKSVEIASSVAVLEPEGTAEAPVAPAVEVVRVVQPEADSWQQERQALLDEWQREKQQLTADWQQERRHLQQELADLENRLHSEKAEWQQKAEESASEAQLELELTQQQAVDLQDQLDQARREIESETAQITHLQDELGELMRRVEAKEAAQEKLLASVQELEQSLQEAQDRCLTLEGEAEERELLKEDLEETIIDRRRELKTLRQSENEARAFAEECKQARLEAEQRVQAAEGELVRLRQVHQQEVSQLAERLDRSRLRQEELQTQVEVAQASAASQDALKEAERRHLEAEKQLILVRDELFELKRDGSDRERLERRCLLLENDLKAANQELMSLERSQTQWDSEKQQLTEEIARLKVTPPSPFVSGPVAGAPVSTGGDEAELRQWKLRADDLRESLRKQRSENERLQERVDVLIKAKELEEKQRKEVESRLRTALRIQARQQGGGY